MKAIKAFLSFPSSGLIFDGHTWHWNIGLLTNDTKGILSRHCFEAPLSKACLAYVSVSATLEVIQIKIKYKYKYIQYNISQKILSQACSEHLCVDLAKLGFIQTQVPHNPYCSCKAQEITTKIIKGSSPLGRERHKGLKDIQCALFWTEGTYQESI